MTESLTDAVTHPSIQTTGHGDAVLLAQSSNPWATGSDSTAGAGNSGEAAGAAAPAPDAATAGGAAAPNPWGGGGGSGAAVALELAVPAALGPAARLLPPAAAPMPQRRRIG